MLKMIVYEGDEIVLHHHKGNSAYTIITFTGINFETVARDFFLLKNVARIRDLDVIGFATKKPNWFLSDEMDEAIRVIDQLLGPDRVRLVFGQSMGGYAALKFSRKLSADYVMALSPKFSIHPDECDIKEEYRKYLTDKMVNMSIKPGDIGGRPFILSDPKDRVDAYHTHLLHNVSPDIVHVPTFYSGHVVYESLSGSKPISSIIEALSSGEPDRVRRQVSTQRRRNPANLRNRLFLASPRHARLVALTLVSDQIDAMKNRMFIFAHTGFVTGIIYQVALRGDHALAVRLKRKLMKHLATQGPSVSFDEVLATNNIAGPLCLDFHERVLYYDPVEKRLTVERLTVRASRLLPVYPGENSLACVTILGERFMLVATGETIDFVPTGQVRAGSLIFQSQGAHYTIRLGRKLVTSVHGGSIAIWTDTDNTWERFVVV
ncbi:hypothetical protein [Asaia spathodeae]|uniref:Alpha/beta hydrolase n=1 Tax=Asaia spathodeae TaxID=657016 RepID=A0ABX2P2F3_9PROT|nr:hypothetical protein [Asaia spathodeae]